MRKKSKVITVLLAFVFVFMLQTVTNASEEVSNIAAHATTRITPLPDGSYKTDTEIIIEPSISGAFTGAAAGAAGGAAIGSFIPVIGTAAGAAVGAIAGGIAGWIFGPAY